MKQIKALFRISLFFLMLESAFAIHEYGHLREFQKKNIPVKEFSLGIGPAVYQHQTASFVLSFRLIPIMAYVMPTEKDKDIFEGHASLWDKIAVYKAGVQNNFLIVLTIAVFFQIIGWTRGNITALELAKKAAITPFKILFRFFSFLIGCVTLNRVNLTDKCLLSTGGIDPPKPLNMLAGLNLMLGVVNLSPFLPLDGGHIAKAILSSAESYILMPDIPGVMGIILFAAFFIAAQGENFMLIFEKE